MPTETNPPAVLPADAMTDETVAARMKDEPGNADAQLDAGIDQSMDASDPPASVQPGDNGDPLPSSGYDPEAEDAAEHGAGHPD